MEDQFVLCPENFTNKKTKKKTELEENDQAHHSSTEVHSHGGLQAAIQPTDCLMS